MYGPCRSSIDGGHALTPPTGHSLGEPLPHQQADQTEALPKVSCDFTQHKFLEKNMSLFFSVQYDTFSFSVLSPRKWGLVLDAAVAIAFFILLICVVIIIITEMK